LFKLAVIENLYQYGNIVVTMSNRYRRQTTVVRIPKEAYEEAEGLRNEYMKRPRNGSDRFAITAIAGVLIVVNILPKNIKAPAKSPSEKIWPLAFLMALDLTKPIKKISGLPNN